MDPDSCDCMHELLRCAQAAEQLAGLCLQDQQQLRDSAPSMEADLQAPPMMFQTRRDGRVVSVTSGFALDFARSKGMFLPVHGPQ